MKVYPINPPYIGARGAVAVQGDFKVESESGDVLYLRIDLPKGTKWGKGHESLLVDLAEQLDTTIINT